MSRHRPVARESGYIGGMSSPWTSRRGRGPALVTLGCMNFGRRTPEAESRRIIERALARGVRTFDTATRNMFDLTAIPIVQQLSHLPIIADPSHGTGIRDKVIPMARAAVAAGAHGVMVEVHPNPERALSDGAQSLYPEQFAELVGELRAIASAIGRTIAPAPEPHAAARAAR